MPKARTRRRSGAPDTRLNDITAAPPERWSHGADYDVGPVDFEDVVARRCQRVSGPVDGLRRSGRILDGEVAAAARWVSDYERSLRSSYCDPVTAGIRGGGANRGPELRWLGGIVAATRLAQVRDALGLRAVELLIVHLHYSTSLRARVASENGGSVGGAAMGRAAEELATVLRNLSAHYQECDRHSLDGVLRPRAVAHVGQGMAA